MSIADELEKLETLHRRGTLNDQEFAQAKTALLAGSASPAGEQIGLHLEHQLAEVTYQNELARLDREWEMDCQKYMIIDRYGRRQIPSRGMGLFMAVVGGTFGVFWTVMAFAITGSAPDVGPFGIMKTVFPLFGIIFILAAIGFGLYSYSRALQYEKALAEYQSRRNALGPESFK